MRGSASEVLVFLRSILDDPRRVGAVMPSSSALARQMAKHVRLRPGQVVVELGAGTGVVTKALLEAGVPRDRLFVVELDGRLADYIAQRFPGISVINGDAARIGDFLPPHLVGQVSTVISSLPLRPMPPDLQRRIVDAAFAVMPEDGALIQYTYPTGSPLPAESFGLVAENLGRIWFNVPPAAVWRFTRRKGA